MDRNISKIITSAIREKENQQKRNELAKSFKSEIRKEIKSGPQALSNVKFTNGKSLAKTLVDENLPDFIDILINEIIKRTQLEGENKQRRGELLHEFNLILNVVPKEKINALNGSDGDTLLQSLCDFKLPDFVNALFNQNSDLAVDLTSEQNTNRPILIAAYRGDAETLKILFTHNANVSNAIYNENETNETILQLILRSGHGNSQEKKRFHQCLELLLGTDPHDGVNVAKRIKEEITQIVNYKDKFHNTALQYATRMWSNTIVLELLKHGASIGDLVQNISPETLKEFLDGHCIQSNYNANARGNSNSIHEDNDTCIHIEQPQLEVTYDYSFLISTTNASLENDGDKESSPLMCSTGNRKGLYETKALRDMAQSKQHRHLLNHPVITSFLWLKWIQTRRYYNINLRFYAFFVFTLTWFVLYGIRGESKLTYTTTFHVFLYIISVIMVSSTMYDTVAIFTADKIQNEYKRRNKNNEEKTTCCQTLWKNKIEILFNVIVLSIFIVGMVIYPLIQQHHLWCILLALNITLSLRECFQICVYGRRYFCSLENWFEICIVVLVSFLLHQNIEIEAKRHLAAIVIVLSWIELIKLVGHSGQLPGHNR